MQMSISEIRNRVRILGQSIFAPSSLLNIPESATSDGTPNVEIIDGKYHYVLSERGMEISRKVTDDENELLYWICKRIASHMASDYEIKHRRGDVDSRRLKFEKEIALLKELNSSWGARIESEIEEILQLAPYDDLSNKRVKYCQKLMPEGIPGEEAYTKGCEKYPVPTYQDFEEVDKITSQKSKWRLIFNWLNNRK